MPAVSSSSRAAGLLAAALLVAVSPFMVWYSQEARAYALFVLFCGLSFLFWARAYKRRQTRESSPWWAVFSVLAVLTHFFAGFLIAPEAILLLYRLRDRRDRASPAPGVAVVQAAVLPMALSDTSHPLGWIQTFPLSVRIKQVPVDFALSSLYHSSLVTHGLLGAADRRGRRRRAAPHRPAPRPARGAALRGGDRRLSSLLVPLAARRGRAATTTCRGI